MGLPTVLRRRAISCNVTSWSLLVSSGCLVAFETLNQLTFTTLEAVPRTTTALWAVSGDVADYRVD